MTDALTISSLEVAYGSTVVLDHIDLRVPQGGCVGLVGESGSGKSTLARTVAGLQRPNSGTVHIPASADAAVSPVQMVFQDPVSSLNPRRPVVDVVAEPLTIRGEGTREHRRQTAREYLDRVGIDPMRFADERPMNLSGGQAQRVAIARALAARPALLLCDEPVSSLDVSVQARVLNLLADLRENEGLSMLFISHDLAVVRMIADEVAVLSHGRIVEFGETESVISAPQHEYTRQLVDAAPHLPETLPKTLPEGTAP